MKNQNINREFYMPSSRGPSSRNSSESKDSNRLSGSLLYAGQSIAFPKRTIEDTQNRNH